VLQAHLTLASAARTSCNRRRSAFVRASAHRNTVSRIRCLRFALAVLAVPNGCSRTCGPVSTSLVASESGQLRWQPLPSGGRHTAVNVQQETAAQTPDPAVPNAPIRGWPRANDAQRGLLCWLGPGMDGSGEPIASRQAQRDLSRAHVVKVARFVGTHRASCLTPRGRLTRPGD
jgi:hypothetical protein